MLTSKLHDKCYCNMLKKEREAPGLYRLNLDSKINNSECLPNNHTPFNKKLNSFKIDIENNLKNLETKDTNCIEGNKLEDKRLNNPSNDLNLCNFNFTEYSKMDLNNINLSEINNNRLLFPFNKKFGNKNDYNFDGRYGYKNCKESSNSCDLCINNRCYTGSDIQKLIGINTTKNVKDGHEEFIKKNVNTFPKNICN